MTDRDQLARLGGLAHDATRDLSHRDSAVDLYRAARDVAEARLPGPLGVGVAAVLAEAAYRRDLHGTRGTLGASNSMLTLALAVLALPTGPAIGADLTGPTATIAVNAVVLDVLDDALFTLDMEMPSCAESDAGQALSRMAGAARRQLGLPDPS